MSPWSRILAEWIDRRIREDFDFEAVYRDPSAGFINICELFLEPFFMLWYPTNEQERFWWCWVTEFTATTAITISST